jgi:glycosyltransferase involved in cell wall biosynthesis
MERNNKPRLSIGLPVYNGEKYLSAAIDSILNQTYTDFELIISDNNSTDKTQAICQSYAQKDNRIKYYRFNENVGASKNFNYVFEVSTGEYFKWAADDDLITPDFVEKCIEILDRDSSVVLCHPKTRILVENSGERLNFLVTLNTDSTKPHTRFREMIYVEHWCFQVFGVFRRQALNLTSLIPNISGADKILLAEISLVGRVYEIPEYLFIRRAHRGSSTSAYQDNRDLMDWYDPSNASRRLSPTWLKFRAYFNAINHIPLTWQERILCYFELGRSVVGIMGRKLIRKLWGSKVQADNFYFTPVEEIER